MKAKKVRTVEFGKWGYFFVTPFVITFLVFQLYPIMYTMYLGFTNMRGSSLEHKLVGFENFYKESQTLSIEGLDAENGRTLKAALDAVEIAYDSDVPEEEAAGSDPFSIDGEASSDPFALDTTEAEAPSDPFALDTTSESDSTDAATDAEATGATAVSDDPFNLDGVTSTEADKGFFIYMSRLNDEDFLKASEALKSAGLDEQKLKDSTKIVRSGLLFDKIFWGAFGNTWILWAFNFAPQLLFGLLFAVWFTDQQLKLRAVGLFKTIFYLPNIITAASVAVLFASLFGYPTGPLNQMLVKIFSLDESINFFRDVVLTRGIVSFIQFWMWFGSSIIVLTAGIVGIPDSLYEAAVVDGASSWICFRRITLPLLRPIMSYSLVTSLIGGMQMFDIPYLITNRRGDPAGSITTTPIYLFNQAFSSSNNYSYAAAISIGMFLLILVFALIVYLMMRDQDELTAKKGAQ